MSKFAKKLKKTQRRIVTRLTKYAKIFALLLVFGTAFSAQAISLSLDSIAEWGKFPRFCVNTYRWGDHFFNAYDTAYVVGTGYKFNVKFKSDSWIDYYNFDLPNKMRMRMLSDPSTSVGAYLTYLAVSVGYSRNVSHFFGSTAKAKQQFDFGFSCSLFYLNLYYIDNDVGTKISKFGPRGNTYNPHLDFDGVHTKTLGADLYYFFNHKKYSQAAAFSFSRVQTHSQGSFLAGLSFSNDRYSFDFSQLPNEMKQYLPTSWIDDKYTARNHNYSFVVGYGYNWVFAKNWMLSVLEAPIVGLKKGFINNPDLRKNSFALSNSFKVSLVWNHKQWFAGAIGIVDMDLLYDKDSTFENANISGNISVGYRFNLW